MPMRRTIEKFDSLDVDADHHLEDVEQLFPVELAEPLVVDQVEQEPHLEFASTFYQLLPAFTSLYQLLPALPAFTSLRISLCLS